MSFSANNQRIAKNTLMLYLRMLLMTGVSFYTVRVVLNTLGVEDYGIYNVVGGIVALFAFLPGAMASATQRFFSFALGQSDLLKLKKIFTTSWVIYAAIAVIALVLLESVGLWFVNEHLKIPAERFESALWLYHLSILTFIVGIATTPFMSIIIAHEDMQIYAYMSVGEALLKLGAVFLLMYLPGDKLELYGLLVLAASFLTGIAYIGICLRKYEECQFRKFYWDRCGVREMVGFTGWTLFGQVTTVARTQAVTILLNQFFNPVVVAARAIAASIANQANIFSRNFNTGLYPPIIKAYAANEKQEMFSLIFNGSKITFFLMWILVLPLFLEMECVLAVWLKEPPVYTVLFTRLALVEVLINAVSLPLTTAARAPGDMKLYESVLGSIQIAIFLVAWLVLAIGGAPYSVFIVAIIANIIMFFVRLMIIRGLIGISIRGFFMKVMLPVFGVMLLSSIPSFFVDFLLPDGIIFSAISIALSMILTFVCVYFIGLDKGWREKVRMIIRNKILSFSSYS